MSRPKYTSKRWKIVPFAGFYKIYTIDTEERVGGLYPSYNDAERALINLEREYLGIGDNK